MTTYRKQPCPECKGKMLVDQFLCKADGCDCGFLLVPEKQTTIPDKLLSVIVGTLKLSRRTK